MIKSIRSKGPASESEFEDRETARRVIKVGERSATGNDYKQARPRPLPTTSVYPPRCNNTLSLLDAMFDIALRSYKDQIFDPISRSVPSSLTPLRITGIAFLCGLSSCLLACTGNRHASILFWLLNRALDCLDGAVARHRKQQSDLGGFLDLLGDFIVYALVPICCFYGQSYGGTPSRLLPEVTELLIVALLEAAFFINNFILFYIAALVEKGISEGLQRQTNEVTSVAMRPALIEGFESGVFFTLMLSLPDMVGVLSLLMLLGVVVGICQRVHWLVVALVRADQKQS